MYQDRLSLPAIIVAFTFCVPGCSDKKVPFTGSLSQRYNLSTADLSKLQFYTAAPIKLSREVLANHNVGTAMGKLVERRGKIVEEVYIPAGTPGVTIDTQTVETASLFGLLKSSHQVMFLSFESGTAIRFVGYDNGTWAPQHDQGNITWFTNDGREWRSAVYGAETQLAEAYLLVSENSLAKVEHRSTTAKGVRVNR